MNVKWTLLFWFLKIAAAQGRCDYYYKITASEVFSIQSPNYPNNYSGANQCRWIFDCPSGYNCRLDCSLISIPQSIGCIRDKLLVSRSGDPMLLVATAYCGQGSLSLLSTRQRITLGLITLKNTNGGNFQCKVSAQPVALNSNCQCGMKRKNRVVGGTETGINEFPMMVGLYDLKNKQIKCGGVIISNYFVQTAAHCVNSTEVDNIDIVVGEHDVTKNDSVATRVYKVSRFDIHPLYKDGDFDIALIRVKDPIQFNDRVGPVCLPFKFKNENFNGKKITVIGWGTVSSGGEASSVLLEADLDVISQKTCLNKSPSVTNRQICTYTEGKDSCQGDSGGPLLYMDPKTGLLFTVGIVSNGKGCASEGNPGINTRVTAFLDWIVATTGANYCIK